MSTDTSQMETQWENDGEGEKIQNNQQHGGIFEMM